MIDESAFQVRLISFSFVGVPSEDRNFLIASMTDRCPQALLAGTVFLIAPGLSWLLLTPGPASRLSG